MDKNKLNLTVIFFLTIILCLSNIGWSVDTEYSFQKGICYATWEKDRYNSAYSDRSLEILVQMGTEWIAIITTYYQERYNSKAIFPTERTPSDNSIIHVINYAHKLGLKVMLKPHLDLIDSSGGLWRADIGFQTRKDWEEWFSEYLKFILHYARIAQQTNVELFCIGTELSFASQQSEFWHNYIIPKIREIYKGKLTYAANWDEFKNIHFWNKLDYVGINAYFPLTNKKDPSYEEIEEGWRIWADEIEAWQKTINKPIIFTEIGYRSCEFTAMRPWDNTYVGNVDVEIQADCYRAALNILSGCPWFKGIYWWYWKPSPYAGGLTNRDFTPQNKPAQHILTWWYKGILLTGGGSTLSLIENYHQP